MPKKVRTRLYENDTELRKCLNLNLLDAKRKESIVTIRVALGEIALHVDCGIA